MMKLELEIKEIEHWHWYDDKYIYVDPKCELWVHAPNLTDRFDSSRRQRTVEWLSATNLSHYCTVEDYTDMVDVAGQQAKWWHVAVITSAPLTYQYFGFDFSVNKASFTSWSLGSIFSYTNEQNPLVSDLKGTFHSYRIQKDQRKALTDSLFVFRQTITWFVLLGKLSNQVRTCNIALSIV